MSVHVCRAEEGLPLFADQRVISDDFQQMIVVVTEDWGTVRGRLWRFERKSGKHGWNGVGEVWPIVVGRHGMGWGIGEHGGPPPSAKHLKREGDGRAPAGVFALVEMYGKKSAQESGIKRFPYRQMLSTMRGVDDPSSRYYNRIIDRAVVEKPDWQSAEIMLRQDALYDLGVVVAHNWKPFPGRGSCIFLHTWRGPKTGTAGCTAMSAERMTALGRWLDHSKKPVLVQLPRSVYQSLQKPWALPASVIE